MLILYHGKAALSSDLRYFYMHYGLHLLQGTYPISITSSREQETSFLLRKIRGMSQEKLAEKAGISRSLLSVIEAPNIAHCFSMEVFYNIADALDVSPSDLLTASLFPDNIINKSKPRSLSKNHYSP